MTPDHLQQLRETIYCTTGCGSNADPADGFGYCTCGAEDKLKAIVLIFHSTIEAEVVAARIDENRIAYNEISKKYRGFGTRSDYQSLKYKSEGNGIRLKTAQAQKLLNLRLAALQATTPAEAVQQQPSGEI